MPQDIPPAIRSRCVEIFFRPLVSDEVSRIAYNAAKKVNFSIADRAVDVIKQYSSNGRDVVNIIQIAAGVAINDHRQAISCADVEWVINFGQYSPRPDKKIPTKPQPRIA